MNVCLKLLVVLALLVGHTGLNAQHVTFQVDMTGQAVGGAVYISGPDFDAGVGYVAQLTDPDGNQIYTGTFPVLPGLFRYRFLNGNTGEPLDGATIPYCTVTDNEQDYRFALIGTTDTTLPVVCWNQCLACGNMAPPADVDVTFRVDMNQTPVLGTVYVTGNPIDGWCGNCVGMTDANTDGIYEHTHALPPGAHEFKFTNNGWANGENFPGNASCGVSNFGYNNRIVYVPIGAGAVVTDAHPFNACGPATRALTLRVDMTGHAVSSQGVFIATDQNGWDPSATPLEYLGNNLWQVNLLVAEDDTLYYRFLNGNTMGGAEAVPGACGLPATGGPARWVVPTDENQRRFTVCFAACGTCADSMTMVWSDEFAGPNISAANWNFEQGTGDWGWGNNELQNYTNRADNATIANGNLVITARQENYQGSSYTSARMTTRNKVDFTYGRWEARISLPQGQGIWPAFWLMPTNSVYGGWPRSGEIDIMEMLGHQTDRVYGTLHYGPDPGDGHIHTGEPYYHPTNGSFAGNFHEFAMEWEPEQIRWFVDGVQVQEQLARDLSPFFWPFQQDFYIILNVAVGGQWPGNPNASTTFPQQMMVDYVRVYQKSTVGTAYASPNAPAPSLNLFPNPTQDRVWLQTSDQTPVWDNVTVRDASGRAVLHHTHFPAHQAVDVSALPAGVYAVEAQAGNRRFVQKLIRL